MELGPLARLFLTRLSDDRSDEAIGRAFEKFQRDLAGVPPRSPAMAFFDVVFDGPPGPEGGRFVEVEDPNGHSIRHGEWIDDREDKLWALRFPAVKELEAHHIDENTRLHAKLETTKRQADGAYEERDRCVALLTKFAVLLGFKCGLGKHDPNDDHWDPEWMNIVYIEVPTGYREMVQLSWHIHDRELPLFSFLEPYAGAWDGHTTAEKYQRMEEMCSQGRSEFVLFSPSAGAEAVEAALDAALGEVRRQGGPEYLLKEARGVGILAANVRLQALLAREDV